MQTLPVAPWGLLEPEGLGRGKEVQTLTLAAPEGRDPVSTCQG